MSTGSPSVPKHFRFVKSGLRQISVSLFDVPHYKTYIYSMTSGERNRREKGERREKDKVGSKIRGRRVIL